MNPVLAIRKLKTLLHSERGIRVGAGQEDYCSAFGVTLEPCSNSLQAEMLRGQVLSSLGGGEKGRGVIRDSSP